MWIWSGKAYLQNDFKLKMHDLCSFHGQSCKYVSEKITLYHSHSSRRNCCATTGKMDGKWSQWYEIWLLVHGERNTSYREM